MKAPTTPQLSVGLPVYNGEMYLAEAIESILQQDFTAFELILSDNGSTDQTPRICAHYAAIDPRVRFYRSEVNRGGAWNFNRVFELSTAPLFKWHAHDDICLPGFFRTCINVLDHAPASVVVVYPRTQITDQDRRPLSGYTVERMETHGATAYERLGDVLRGMTMVCAQFGIIRSSALRQTRMFDSMIAADFVLIAELALLGELWEVPEVLFERRIHASISTKANRNSHQLLQWWDPTKSRYKGILSPSTRLGWEYLRSIRRMPLPLFEKILCFPTALWTWYFREFRNAGGRLKYRLRHRLVSQAMR